MGYVAALLGLVLLIVVHEFGHWLVARFFGFATPVFSIGFGPRKWSIILGTFWETEFRLSPILLGGYVAIPELGDESSARSIFKMHNLNLEPRHFAIWKRALVACAGVVMNILLAFFMLFAIFGAKGLPQYDVRSVYVGALDQNNTIARDAGVQANDTILAVDSVKIATPQDLQTELAKHKGTPVTLHLKRGNQSVDILLTPNQDGKIGIAIGVVQDLNFRPVGVGKAFLAAGETTIGGLVQITHAFAGLLHITTPPPGAEGGVHSIVGIVQYTAGAWETSFFNYVWILFTISLNLAILNILPIPMLDGGHLLFMAIEKVRGKPLHPETQARIQLFFLILLLLLFFWGLRNDFTHPIGK